MVRHLPRWRGNRSERDQRNERAEPHRSASSRRHLSDAYFRSELESTGAYGALVTTGVMAPEAYVLDAVVRSWFISGNEPDALAAAAEANDRYQHCGIRAARRLFNRLH